MQTRSVTSRPPGRPWGPVPRAGLTPQAVVELALRVVDEGGARGADELSLAAVARLAGVAVPSLYKHVGSLDHLRAEVARRCVAEITEVYEAAVRGQHGADAIVAVAVATRRWALAHPGRYGAVQTSPRLLGGDGADGEGAGGEDAGGDSAEGRHARRDTGARTVEVIATALHETGVPAPRTVDGVRAVRAAIHGFVDLELSGGFGMPDDVDQSFDALVRLLLDGLGSLCGADAEVSR